MEFISRQTPKNFNIFFIGDVHVGTKLHYGKGFARALAMLKKPYKGAAHNVAIFMGDLIEAIDTSDKRFDIHSVDRDRIRCDEQMDYVQDLLLPVKAKIVVALEGNHEFKLKKYYDYTKGLCSNLGVPFGTYTSIITFVDANGEPRFKVYATHGYGSISSVAGPPERIKANLETALKRKLMNQVADCIIQCMGHTHKLIVAEPINTLYLTSGNGAMQSNYAASPQNADYIHPDHRWYLNTGSFTRLFVRGVSGYAERAGYAPMELGFPIARVRGGQVIGVDKVVL